MNLVAMPLPHTFHTDVTHCSEEEPCCEGKFFGHLLLALTNLIPYDPRSRRAHALVHLHQLLILQQTGPSHVSAASRKGSSREGQDVLTFVINVNLRSLESLLSLYSSTWFSSWSPAELDNFCLTGFHQDHGQKGSQTVFFFTDSLLSLIHVKGGCLVPGGFSSNRSLTYTFFVVVRPFLHALLVLLVHLNNW